MEDIAIIMDLSLALGGALLAGMIALRLRQPAILGYLTAGVIVGPHTPLGLQPERVMQLAELGILLLMFSLGIQFSLAELRRVQAVAVYGTILQLSATIALGLGIGSLLGFTPLVGLFFGALIAISSTVVAVKVLTERGEMDSTHGRVMLGICLVQDLSLVPLIVVLPALAGPMENLPAQVGLATLKAALVLGLTLFVGTRLLPRVLFRVAATRSRELFLVTIVFIALGTAAGVSFAGLSISIGAFLAGLVISESQYSHQTLADVLPLRDLFAVLFFVSMGMLVDPAFLLANAALVAGVVFAILAGKFLIVAGIVRLFGYPLRTAIFAGMGLLQIGEFSFLLAGLGVERQIIPESLFSLTVGAALITIVMTPLAMNLAGPLVGFVRSYPPFQALLGEGLKSPAGEHPPLLSGHAVILGYGDVGQTLSQVLRGRSFPHIVIDRDPHAVEALRASGLPCVYGDGANELVLAQTNLGRARLLAVTLPDPIAARLAVEAGRRLNPRLDIVVRAPTPGAVRILQGSGATEVINPSLEVSMELTRHALHRFGLSSIEALSVVNRLRLDRYSDEGESRT
jgi:CPA2 family monovalent cation:H+ antiporter-2